MGWTREEGPNHEWRALQETVASFERRPTTRPFVELVRRPERPAASDATGPLR
jgi:hypothetical protein